MAFNEMVFTTLMIPMWLFLGMMFGIWASVMIECVRAWLVFVRTLPGIDTMIQDLHEMEQTKNYSQMHMTIQNKTSSNKD